MNKLASFNRVMGALARFLLLFQDGVPDCIQKNTAMYPRSFI